MGRPRSTVRLEISEPDADPAAAAPSALTSERARLADAIAKLSALKTDIASASAAISEAQSARLTTFSARARAERMLERSQPKPDAPYSVGLWPLSTVYSREEDAWLHAEEQNIPPLPIAEARDALSRAVDAYSSAVRSEQFHQDRLQRLQADLIRRTRSVDEAISAVVRADPALLALANEAKRLATRARAAAVAFKEAVGSDVIQPGSPFYGCTEPATSRQDFDGWALPRAWHQAREALLTDAAAPLPTPEDHR